MDEKEVKAMLESSADETRQALTAMLDENFKKFQAQAIEQAEAAAKAATETALDQLPEVKQRKNGARIEVTDDPADREFKSVGENCIAIARHIKGTQTHPRIRGLQAKAIAAASADGDQAALEAAYKAALGSNEAIPSQGEFLLEPTITQTLLKPMHETGIFSTKVNRLPVGPNSNSGWIPGVDETSRAAGSRWGGVRGYHMSEAASLTASQPKFRRINWELHKVAVLQYATDELLRDAAQLTAIVNQSSAEELDFMANDDLFRGAGGDRPVGVMNAGNLISVARFATSQVNWIDLVSMWQRMHPRFKGGAEWYVNSEVMPELDRLASVSHAGTTEMPPRFVDYDANGVMRIKGKPVYETEYNEALGTAGDILLGNFGEYLFWEKGAIEAAMSIHVQFLTDQTAFRFIARYDGQAADASAITPYKGTNTQSPFVCLSASTS
jgi:HK97 family phage major capsid protein